MHEMDWQRLERLTVDLFGYEPDIATSDDYGTLGQTDHGVDVIARRRGNDGEEVASCKNREEIEADDLVEWSDNFLKHWQSNWSTRDIRRFVLATTAQNTGDRHIQNKVTEERRRFKALNVEYELWGPKQFVHKLRPRRAVTAQYLGEVWAEIICGPSADYGVRTGSSSAMISAGAVAQMADLQQKLSGQAAKRAEAALNDLRAGRVEAVRSLADELRSEDVWMQLDATTQARILRLAAALAIRDDDFDEAETLNVAAEALAPAEEGRIAAQIAFERDGAEAAIQALGEPKSIAGKQLFASLLLASGRLDALEPLIQELTARRDDAESLRICALYRLAQGDRNAALQEIHGAEALAGDWTAILVAGVIVRHALAVSPVVRPQWLFYPNPVDAALVKADDEVQELLRQALGLLDRLDATNAPRADAALWRLAVIANQRNGQADASAHARALLQSEPDQPTVIAWCLTRRLDVDLAPSLAALKAKYEGGLTLFHARVLGLMLAIMEPGPDAAAFLKKHLAGQSPETGEEIERWIARLEDRDVPRREDEGDWGPDALREVQQTGDWSAIPALLTQAFATHPPHPAAMTLAQAVADFGKWELLDGWVERLLEFETPTAVRLAAFAASRLGEPSKALAIIDENAAQFGEALPAELRRLRADSLLRVGDVQAALREADQLSATSDLPADRMFKAELMVSIGNLRGGATAVREALRTGELPPAHALRWSALLQEEEPELSRQLWRHAVSADLGDDLVVAAMHQAFQLGLDNEVGALMPRVQARAAAGFGDVRLVSLDEVVELITRNREAAADDEKLYLQGAIPAHLFVRGNEAAFLAMHAGRSQSPDGPFRLRLIRHGARPRAIEHIVDWKDWAIHLDISGLLEAAQLGLMDVLEQHPNPIRISPHLPSLLIKMQQDAHASQASRVEAARSVLKCLVDGLASEAGAPPEGAQSFAADETNDSVTGRLASLVASLRGAGLLSEDEAAQKLAQFGPDANGDPVDLNSVTALYFDGSTVEEAAVLGLLPLLCRRFRVTVDAAYIEELKAKVAGFAEEDRLADFVGGLRTRIADGIQNGVYQPLAARADDEELGDGLLANCLKDMLGAGAADNGVVWIDDRLVSGYARTNAMPVIGVVDALHAMLRDGVLDEQTFEDKLLALRASGAVLIPFAVEEVTRPLLSASVVDGHVIETDALETVRRSVGAVARIEMHLKIGDVSEHLKGRPDEVEYSRSVMRLVSDALQEVWTAPNATTEEQFARSDWAWANLRMTQVNRTIVSDDPAAAQDHFEVMQIAHCLDKAFDIGGVRDEHKDRRLHFLHWMWERTIRQKAAVDPTFLPRLSKYLATFYEALLKQQWQEHSPRERDILNRLLLMRIQRLPDPVRDEVFHAPYLRKFVGVGRHVVLGSATFDPYRFWRAARAARRYGRAKLRTIDGKRVRLRRDQEALLLTGAIRVRLKDDILDVVASRKSEMGAALDRYLEALDVAPAAQAELKAQALTSIEPQRLAAILEQSRADAPSTRYGLVVEKLRSRRAFDAGLLAPVSAERLMLHLRLPERELSAASVGQAFRALEDTFSSDEAFRRLGGLPLSIVNEALEKLEDAELDRLAKAARTPMQLIHAAAALRRKRGDDPLVNQLVERLVGVTADHGQLFAELLRWVEKLFYRDGSWRELPESMRRGLVWAHSDRLMDAFMTSSSAPTPMREFFEGNPPPIAAPDLVASRQGADDQSRPQNLSGAAILYHGLAEIFADDDVAGAVSADIAERIKMTLTSNVGELIGPDLSLILRRADGADAMDSFLRKKPVGVLDEDLDPDRTRDLLVDGALSAIEAGGDAALAAWPQVAAFAAGGLSDAQQARFSALVQGLDLWALAFLGQEPQLVRWRAVLAPMLADDRAWVIEKINELAAKCRQVYGANLDAPAEPGTASGSEALSELVEIIALAAGDADDKDESLSDLIAGIALRWPEAAPQLRVVVDNLLALTPASRARSLWGVFQLLRSCR